jgi:AraC family transcriptional regulator, regulatory protein of adaptative response / methylated-DNA-[protein]-cysteine methyltransferase
MEMKYGFFESPFGKCCMAFTSDGLSTLIFADSDESALNDLQKRFPGAKFHLKESESIALGKDIFENKKEIKLNLSGTDFQKSVWNALKTIPSGTIISYVDVANMIGKPKAVRAVGTAIGANPIAWLIPCHRVLRSDGKLGGYRWGLALKIKMLKAEGKAV